MEAEFKPSVARKEPVCLPLPPEGAPLGGALSAVASAKLPSGSVTGKLASSLEMGWVMLEEP